MTKKEFIKAVAKSADIPERQVASVIEAAISEIKNTVKGGGEVIFRQFGTFSLAHRSAKAARNMNTGEKIIIPEKDVPHFRPSQAF